MTTEYNFEDSGGEKKTLPRARPMARPRNRSNTFSFMGELLVTAYYSFYPDIF
jgi:hypothetical protein